MKVLFLYTNIATIGYNSYSRCVDTFDSWLIPLGICYLAAALKREGHEVDLIDFRFEKDFLSVKKKVQKSNAKIVGISFQSPGANYAYQAAQLCKEEGKIVIAGGIHPTVLPEEVFKTGFFDHVVVGDGISSLVKLVNDIKTNIRREGIIYGDTVTNLDSIPFPYLFDAYKKVAAERKIINLITSRGCPGKCTFCQPVVDKVFGRKALLRSADNILSEILLRVEEFDIKHFMIMDDTFTVNKKRVIEFCHKLKQQRLGISWTVHARVDTLDEEMIVAMVESGSNGLCIGFESASQRILDYLNKKTTVEKGYMIAELCNKHKMLVVANLLVGVPTETIDDYKLNFQFVSTTRPNYIKYNYFIPFPGTTMYDECLQNGSLDKNTDFDKYEMDVTRESGKGLLSSVNYNLPIAWHIPIFHWKDMNGNMEMAELLAGGIFAEREKNMTLAEEKFNRLHSLFPDYLTGHYYLAKTIYLQNRYEKSMELFQKVIECSNKVNNDYFIGASSYFMGLIKKKCGDVENARSCFLTCLDIIPNHQTAQKELHLIDNKHPHLS